MTSEETYFSLRFVLPEGTTESTCPKSLKDAFKKCLENEIIPSWTTNEAALKLKPLKQDVFVLDPFEGVVFDHLRKFKCTIVGPRCLLSSIEEGKPVPEPPYPIFTAAMRGAVLTSTGFNAKNKEKIRTLTQRMGGIYANALHDGVTHLICESVTSQKYKVASKKSLPIMTLEWLEQIWEASKNRNMHADDPDFRQFACPPFKGLTICVSQMKRQEKEVLKKKIEDNGGTYSGVLDKEKTAILIVSSTQGEKYRHAIEWEIPCVTPLWIDESVKQGKCLSTIKFSINRVKASTPTKETEGDTTKNLPEVSLCSMIIHPDKVVQPDAKIIDETAPSRNFTVSSGNKTADTSHLRPEQLPRERALARNKPSFTADNEEETLAEYENDLLAQYSTQGLSEAPPGDDEKENHQVAAEEEAEEEAEASVTQVSQFFVNKKMAIVGFDEETESHLSDWLGEAGGEIVFRDFQGTLDYLIVPLFGCRNSGFRAKLVLTNLWLEDCLDQGCILSPPNYFHKPLQIDSEQRPCSGVVMGISNYLGREREFLIKLAESLGMTAQEIFAKRDRGAAKGCTHLLCAAPEGAKYEAAIKWNLPAVNKDWLLACWKNMAWVSEKQFLIGRSTKVTEGKPDPTEPTSYLSFKRKRPTETDSQANEPYYLEGIATPGTPYGAFLDPNPSPKTQKLWKRHCQQLARFEGRTTDTEPLKRGDVESPKFSLELAKLDELVEATKKDRPCTSKPGIKLSLASHKGNSHDSGSNTDLRTQDHSDDIEVDTPAIQWRDPKEEEERQKLKAKLAKKCDPNS